jgi:2-polyprenyl-3-methyl-5-hydroxy-6-metoxy-1,4-benzoquinol methylase
MFEDQILEKLLEFQSPLAPDREKELPWVIARLPIEVRVLDAACGGGYLQKYLLQNKRDVLATDIHPDAAYYSAGGEKRPYFVQHDHTMELSADWINNFDCVLLISTIEHVKDGDDLLMVSQLSKCLKKDGLFFITCPSGKDEWLTIGTHSEKFYSLENIENRLLLPNNMTVLESRIFIKEEMGWPFDNGGDWKDILCLSAIKG